MFGGSGGTGAFTFGSATTQAQTTNNAVKPATGGFNFGTGAGGGLYLSRGQYSVVLLNRLQNLPVSRRLAATL